MSRELSSDIVVQFTFTETDEHLHPYVYSASYFNFQSMSEFLQKIDILEYNITLSY